MTGVRKNDGYYVVAGGQVIQLLDANGGAKNFYTDVTKAFAGAADGDTLILLKNTSVSKQLNVTKAITIDLGGCTLTNSYDGSGYSLLTRAAVTMKNGTYKSTKGSARGHRRRRRLYAGECHTERGRPRRSRLLGPGCDLHGQKFDGHRQLRVGELRKQREDQHRKRTITGSGVGIYHNGSNSGLQLTAADSTITAGGGQDERYLRFRARPLPWRRQALSR